MDQTQHHYELLPINAITVSNTRVQSQRRMRYTPESLLELAANIQAMGVVQPIVVRKLTPTNGHHLYEIVAGERRYLASSRANLTHIPAVVRELDDRQAIEIQLVENLQRAELHPLDEAEAYRELIDTAKLSTTQIAQRIGKSPTYVRTRLKLLDLISFARDALQRGEIDITKAALVASLPESAQEKALSWIHLDFRAFRQAIAHNLMRDLTEAPWALDDNTLVTNAPSCDTCPQRDMDDDKMHMRCPDGPCYMAKQRAWAQRQKAHAIEQGHTILSGKDAKDIINKNGQVKGEYVDLDATCADDDFPEENPECAKDFDDKSEAEQQRLCDEWGERYDEWKPRTYRQLLAAHLPADADIKHVEDPKSEDIRQLITTALANELLEKHHQIKPAQGIIQPNKDQQSDFIKQQQEQADRRDAETMYRKALLKGVAQKCQRGEFTHDELTAMATAVYDIDTAQALDLDIKAKLDSMTDGELRRIIRVSDLTIDLGWHTKPTALMAACTEYKIDTKAIKKQIADKIKAAHKAAEAAASAKPKRAKKNKATE